MNDEQRKKYNELKKQRDENLDILTQSAKSAYESSKNSSGGILGAIGSFLSTFLQETNNRK